MKMKPLYIVIGIIVILIIVGYFTNWFGMGNKIPAPKLNDNTGPDGYSIVQSGASGERMAIVKNQSVCNIQQLNQAFANFSVADAQQMNLYNYYCSNKSNSNYNNWQTAASQAQALASVYNVMYNNCYRAVNGADKNIGISVGPSC